MAKASLFKKGHAKIAGRKKGSINKANSDFKEAVKNLLERNAEDMDAWLRQIAFRSPYKAMDIICKLAEYHIPKLSRVDAKSENVLRLEKVTVQIVSTGIPLASCESDVVM
ncbi:MAG TPA: hypothetical protein VF691_13395 [Cytophagaceae bacterium]|jgi:hypothetical protein